MMMQQSLFGSAVQTTGPQENTSLETLVNNVVFTVIDLETTGLNAAKNSITEITAIKFINGDEQDKYSTLVKPMEAIPQEVEAITGISNDMVAHAPALIMALTELCNFVGDSPIIVGHNVAFDLRFLREKLRQSGLSSFMDRFKPETSVCSKVLAQKTLPGLHSYEGVVVANHCGVYNPNPHRAEYDVRMSAGILFVLLKRLRESSDITTLNDLIQYQGELSL